MKKICLYIIILSCLAISLDISANSNFKIKSIYDADNKTPLLNVYENDSIWFLTNSDISNLKIYGYSASKFPSKVSDFPPALAMLIELCKEDALYCLQHSEQSVLLNEPSNTNNFPSAISPLLRQETDTIMWGQSGNNEKGCCIK